MTTATATKEFHLTSQYNRETFHYLIKFFINEEKGTCKIVHKVFDRYEIMSFLNNKVEKLTIEEGRLKWKEQLETGMIRIK